MVGVGPEKVLHCLTGEGSLYHLPAREELLSFNSKKSTTSVAQRPTTSVTPHSKETMHSQKDLEIEDFELINLDGPIQFLGSPSSPVMALTLA